MGLALRAHMEGWKDNNEDLGMTYESHPACIDERFGGEPFPHESARGPAVDRINQPMNIVVD
jgi:hypothetical protein